MTRLTAYAERVRSSFFYVPMAFVIGGVILGQASIILDASINRGPSRLPLGLTSTVESARTVLSTIASATVTVAGIAFSVSLLIIQLASSQYSPRVVHGLFRDPFNKRVMGIVVGTFTYCLIVLRSVRAPVEPGNDPVVPNVSVAIAVLLGLTAILAIIAFINHSAHSMDVSQILQKVTDDTISQIQRIWPEHSGGEERECSTDVPPEPGFTVGIHRNGWVQHADRHKLLTLLEPGGTVRMDVAVGHYAIRGMPLCTIWPAPDDEEAVTSAAQAAVAIGKTRTMSQDVSYGVRQLADVGLKALSPGVNDPTTAQDAIFHLAAVLAELLRRDAPSRSLEGEDGRRLVDVEENEHMEIISLGFDELRQFSTSQPRVCIYLLEALSLLVDVLEEEGITDRSKLLRDQARLVVAGAERADMLEHDLVRLREAYERRFVASP